MLQRRFLVGTYTTQRASRGLYLCAMDPSGRIDVVDACEMADPSFVVLHPTLPLAYVVNETPTGHGCVSAVAIGDRLEPRQRVDSEGELPCHLAVLDGGIGLAVAEIDPARLEKVRREMPCKSHVRLFGARHE